MWGFGLVHKFKVGEIIILHGTYFRRDRKKLHKPVREETVVGCSTPIIYLEQANWPMQ